MLTEQEEFTAAQTKYAMDNLRADFKANALKTAKLYKDMSKEEIYADLTSKAVGFTEEEAQYAVDNLK